MISGKRYFNRVAGLVGAALAFSMNLGCGGETGGAPNGIAGALTNSTIKVSSFALTTNQAINDIVRTSSQGADASGFNKVAGALYPTRNSKSFRVALKGAGSNLEDVVFYFDIYDPSATGAKVKYRPSTEAVDGNDPSGVYTAADLYTLAATSTATDLPKTKIDQLFVKPNGTTPSQADPVDRASGADPFAPAQTVTVGTTPATVIGKPGYYRVVGAYTYAQPDNARAVRTGVRNVVVQFFSDDASTVKGKYDRFATESGVDAAKDEAAYLSGSETGTAPGALTNAYVFTANIQAGTKTIDLTAKYQTDNGSNGLVDTGSFPVTVPRGNLPSKYGSVQFDVYEETAGLNQKGISYSYIYNFDAANPLADATKTIPFANRQRVLKVYATCYSDKDGKGAVIAETADSSTMDLANYNQPGYPVLFLPTVNALVGDVFNPGSGAVAGTEAQPKLSTMTLVPCVSVVSGQAGLGATVGDIASGVPSPLAVTGIYKTYPRFAFSDPGTYAAPTDTPHSFTGLELSQLFDVSMLAAAPSNAVADDEKFVSTSATVDGTGILRFGNGFLNPTTQATTSTGFDQDTYDIVVDGITKRRSVVAFVTAKYLFGSTVPELVEKVKVLPNLGTTGGTVKGIRR